ncbi:MAG: 3-phosphoshikimate 1-carboxyvinyltransferase [Cytophagia bacterium]|nr:3-phosphoshikimate 1-carboxyvinyltransferase [Cytophagia bacterium]
MLKGTIKLDGDKSLSHRILIFGALSNSKSTIYNLSKSDDVKRTINILKNCNFKIKTNKKFTTVYKSKINQKIKKFYCGNSGTTARFMIGFLPSIGISGTLYGDKSLSKRPMKRLLDSLLKMNVKIKTNKETLPIQFEKSNINPINFTLNHPSAQIKSALIFAALSSKETSIIKDPFKTRNHTENIIKFLGGTTERYKKFSFKGFNYTIPGDISSASFIIAAALLVKGSNIKIKNVLFNETRTGFIKVLQRMGANIQLSNIRIECFEKVADINVQYSTNLKSVALKKSDIINMIDEIPIFALIACFAKGETRVNHAAELRYKESDRIKSIVFNLQKCGAKITEMKEGFIINKSKLLYNTSIKSFQDHRIAMMCEILYLVIQGGINHNKHKIIDTSFPDFYKHLGSLYE